MAFQLRKKEHVAGGIRRIANEQTTAAIDLLSDRSGDFPERIHNARRCIKRLRATLRLVRPDKNGAQYKASDTALRNAAKKLATSRDADVALATFERLAPEMSLALATRIRARLNAAVSRARRRTISPRQLTGVLADFRTSGRTIARMHLKGKGWQILEPGIRKSYASVRHTARKLRDDTEVTVIHEWRTVAKRLLHQLELIRRVLGKSHRKLLPRLTKLCRLLGEFHDMDALAANPAISKTPAIRKLIADRMQTQRKVIRHMAPEIFSEHTRSFVSTLRAGWKKWRA